MAILLDATDDPAFAKAHYQTFKRLHVACFDDEVWQFDCSVLNSFIDLQREKDVMSRDKDCVLPRYKGAYAN